jgi:hypothetical protein
MKRILTSLLCIALYTISYGASVPEPGPIPRNKTIEGKIALELSKDSQSDYGVFTTRKFNFFERLVARVMQIKLRKRLSGKGAIKKNELEKLLFIADRSRSGFHAGGFILGLLLGPVGVLISYLFKDEHKRRRIKWSWLGFAVWVAIILFIAFYQQPVP